MRSLDEQDKKRSGKILKAATYMYLVLGTIVYVLLFREILDAASREVNFGLITKVRGPFTIIGIVLLGINIFADRQSGAYKKPTGIFLYLSLLLLILMPYLMLMIFR